MIRQQAFVNKGNAMLKGGLHTHTTRSDGCDAPEVLLGKYRAAGYDFVAITDHRNYNLKNFAPETGVLVVPGMEVDRQITGDKGIHCFHCVCIGPEAGNGYAQDELYPAGTVADQAEFQPLLDEIHEKNNLTIYCHPMWSRTPACEFNQMKGNFAMEIWNSLSAVEYEIDMDAAYWDELLMQGHRIYGVASDDVHYPHGYCRGWVRVNAEPNVDSILAALKNGEFYASCGPEIYDFYVENGRAVVECSDVDHIRFNSGFLPTKICRGDGRAIHRAEYDLKDYFTYIRASVVDAQGRRAWTNPIWLDK